jgi:hypothetical protein
MVDQIEQVPFLQRRQQRLRGLCWHSVVSCKVFCVAKLFATESKGLALIQRGFGRVSRARARTGLKTEGNCRFSAAIGALK